MAGGDRVPSSLYSMGNHFEFYFSLERGKSARKVIEILKLCLQDFFVYNSGDDNFKGGKR
jgi:hypothetical protein